MKLYIFGRQADIAAAEIESIVGSHTMIRLGDLGAVVQDEKIAPLQIQLGGSIKTGHVIDTYNKPPAAVLEELILRPEPLLNHVATEGKIKLGISVYGDTRLTLHKLKALSLSLKKSLRNNGRSVRLIENKHHELNAAQILYNKLLHENGLELMLISFEGTTYLAKTEDVQDIDSYTLRDRGRPKRDARVGMLPPKLAQILVNLAVRQSLSSPVTILDPFCGTGVVLQEALIMGYPTQGSDIDQRMVEYAQQNLTWAANMFTITQDAQIELGDATLHQWSCLTSENTCIASETYLGRPFTSPPKNEILHKNRADCDTIIRKFLENLARQIAPGVRLCIGVPVWYVDSQIYHLKTLDYLEEIGYNRISFVHANNRELIYHRENQIVGRELLVLIRR
jgi:tRNA G10  N-methylase Trm11